MSGTLVVQLLLAVSGLAVIMVIVSAFARSRQDRINDAWRAAAEELEGRFTPTRLGWWTRDDPRIEATVDGVDVTVDIRVTGSGKSERIFTRIEMPSTAPRETELRVSPEQIFSGLARAVGFQDVPVGDAGFDEAYVVKANDEIFAKAWLNRTVRKHIVAAEGYRFELKRGAVIAERSDFDVDTPRLLRAVRAAVTFSDGKHQVVRAFSKAAKKLGGEAKKLRRGWATLDAEVDGVPVSLGHEEHGKTHFTVATAKVVGSKLTPFTITSDRHEFSATLPKAEMRDLPFGYVAWTREPERASAAMTDDVRARIDDLHPIKVRADAERVKVYLEGIVPTVSRMVGAARLAARLAASQDGAAYR